jgi:hypothetical protein
MAPPSSSSGLRAWAGDIMVKSIDWMEEHRRAVGSGALLTVAGGWVAAVCLPTSYQWGHPLKSFNKDWAATLCNNVPGRDVRNL